MAAVDSRPPKDGLGLGEIIMPGLGEPVDGLAEGAHDPRYSQFRQKIRHAPSHSSPPTLATFAAKTALAAASSHPTIAAPPPAATPVPRKFSLQPTSHYDSHDTISYPMIVSRSDMAHSTFSPHTPPAVPIAEPVFPTSTPTDNAELAQQSRKGSKSRPAPIKLNSSNHTFLAPLLERPFIKRLGSGGKDKEDSESSPMRSRRKGSKVESVLADPGAILLENQTAFEAHYPREETVNITLANSIAAGQRSPTLSPKARLSPVMPTHSIPVQRVPVPDISPRASPIASSPPPVQARRQQHRRAASDDSPRIVQEAAFPRSFGDTNVSARDRPFTTFSPSPGLTASAQRVRKHSTPTVPTSRSHLDGVKTMGHARSYSATALRSSRARIDDAFFAPTPASAPIASVISPTRRPSATPRLSDASNSVGISVRTGVAGSSREVARAPLGAGGEGVTVSLQTPMRPEDVEVGWMCTSGVDATTGQGWTKWEITLKPKVVAQGSDERGANFSTYRLSSSTARPTSVSPTSTTLTNAAAATSPTNISAPAFDFSTPLPQLPRKISVASSSSQPPTFDSQLSGSSFSSESSGPTTPRRTKFGSVDSNAGPFDLLQSLPAAAMNGRSMGKSRSYEKVAEQYRLRAQGGLEEEHGEAEYEYEMEPKTPTRKESMAEAMLHVIPPTPDVAALGSNISTPSSSAHTSDDDDESDDGGVRDAARALARGQQGRIMSKWSDTEGESEVEDEEERGETSWSGVEDGVEEDFEG